MKKFKWVLVIGVMLANVAFAYEMPTVDDLLAKSQESIDKQDYAEAYSSAQHAAALGSKEAAKALAYMYALGLGGTPNEVMSSAWIMVSEWGNPSAMHNIKQNLFDMSKSEVYNKAYAEAENLVRVIEANKKALEK